MFEYQAFQTSSPKMFENLSPKRFEHFTLLRPKVETEKSSDKFEKEDDFLDESDIREKFINKPEQRDRLLSQPVAFVCPSTGADMRAVPKYKKVQTEAIELEKERKRQLIIVKA